MAPLTTFELPMKNKLVDCFVQQQNGAIFTWQ